MSRWSARLGYYLRDAWESIRFSPAVNFLAFGTLLAVLTASGAILLLVANVSFSLEATREEVRVEVFLLDSITDGERTEVRNALEGMEETARLEYVDKEMAQERYESWHRSAIAMMSELDYNPLPASFEVYLAQGVEASSAAAALANRIGGMPGVEEVRYDQDWLDQVDALLVIVRAGSTLAGLAVLLVVVFVVASVLRLAVFARRDEIEIMLLVGATPGFVRGPFLVAGLALGLAGGFGALGLVELLRRLFLAQAGDQGMVLVSLVARNPLGPLHATLLVLTGVLVSLLASFVAVRQDMGSRRTPGQKSNTM